MKIYLMRFGHIERMKSKVVKKLYMSEIEGPNRGGRLLVDGRIG